MTRGRKIESREERDWSNKGPTKLIVIFSLIPSYLRWCHWEKANRKDYTHCPGCTAWTVFVRGSLVTPDPLCCWQRRLSFWTMQGEKVPGIWLGQITVSLSPPAGSHLAVTHSVQAILSIAMPSPRCQRAVVTLRAHILLRLSQQCWRDTSSPLSVRHGSLLLSALGILKLSWNLFSLFLIVFWW